LAEVSFGEWLKRRRKAQGLTQEELALQINCSASALRKIEAEQRRPSEQIVGQLAEVFNIASNERKLFLKFARGNLDAAPTGIIESAPWRVSSASEAELEALSNPKTHLATFLFTDIEGSAKLWENFPEKMKIALQRHHEIMQEAISSNGGNAFQIVGDAFCAVFLTASSAVSAAVAAQRALHQEKWATPSPICVRMGIHTGTAELSATDSPTGGYASNHTLNRVARILSAGHGGQILLSLVTKELVKDSLPADIELRDMGEHHLKNLLRPEHLFQLICADLPSDFPALITLDSYRHNLPLQLTSFIGREREIAEMKYLLSATRLLTLVGPGGTGKTRLSIQVASDLLDQYPDGAWFVELAPISDPLLIPRTTAIAIGLRDEPQRPVIDMLCDYLRGKHLLLVLDNCEHLVEACAQMADTLLHACPQIRILASSREALGIAGETSYLVPSLELPDMQNLPTVEALSQCEAIRLFIERASAATQNFKVTDDNASSIAQICHRLDGIPLAIELAAAKVRALSAGQIAQRLDDRFHLLTGGSRTAMPRHQTLQAAIEWSHNLLTASEQTLFRRLSVFVNGWTLEAAESVCADDSSLGRIRSEDILNLLEHLVNKSLVSAEEWQSETRYRVLETMRQYANEKLVESGESNALRDKHLEYFLNLAETAAPHLIRPEQLEWLAQLDADYENLRAALEWALSKETAELSLRLCAALGRYWYMRTIWLEGSKWLKSALSKTAQNSTPAEKAARVKALYEDAELADQLDDFERMKNSAELSLTLAQKGSDQRDISIARFEMAKMYFRQGDNEKALPLLEQSYAKFQELNDSYWQSTSYHWISKILVTQGKLKNAERDLPNLELAHKAGERSNLAEVLFDYSFALYVSNQISEAKKYAEEGDALLKQIGANSSRFSILFAELAWVNGDYQQARALYMEMRERFGFLGEKNIRSGVTANLGILVMEEGNLDQAQAYLEEALTITRKIDRKYFVANHLAGLGNIFYLQGNTGKCKQNFRESISLAKEFGRHTKIMPLLLLQNCISIQNPESSARILGAIDIAQRERGRTIGPWLKHFYSRAETHAREKLGDAAFESAFADGQKMSLDEALDLALKTVEEM